MGTCTHDLFFSKNKKKRFGKLFQVVAGTNYIMKLKVKVVNIFFSFFSLFDFHFFKEVGDIFCDLFNMQLDYILSLQ